jgi:hypothetical protein
MRRLTKFLSLTRHEKEVLCEAIILLSVSHMCIKAIAFRHVERFLRNHWNDDIDGGIHQEQEIWLVQRSILRAVTVLPWKNLCLVRSVAEFIMLRRRGIPAVMFAGVRFSDRSSLEAHAWVDSSLEANNMSSDNSGFAAVISIGARAVDR